MNLQNVLPLATVLSLAEADERTADLDGTPIDTQDYEGQALAILNSGAASAGTNPTLDCKLQDCDTDDGTFADITGATFTQVTDAAALVEAISFNVSGCKRYVKLVGTLGGTDTPTFAYGGEFMGFKKASA